MKRSIDWQVKYAAVTLASLMMILFLLLGSAYPVSADSPGVPNQFYGTVTINGVTAGSGVTVVAVVNGVNGASTTTDTSGRYGYSSAFMVSGSSGNQVTFLVNGTQAVQTATFQAGGIVNLPLTVGPGGATTSTGTLTIVTSSLSNGTVGTGYTQTLAASGGTGTYTFAILSGSGSLPNGLTLGSSGTITGTPTASGTFTFSVQVTDSAPSTYSKAFSLTIASASTSSSATSITTSILNNTGSLAVTSGVVTTATTVASSDNRVQLSFAANTSLNLQGQTAMGAAEETNPPAAADNSTLLSAYSFSPSGAVFAPAATMILKYAVSAVPAGVNETSLYIAYWDGSTWQAVASTVDTTNKVVSAPVSHFTIFALRAPAVATTTSTSTSTSTSTTTIPSNPTPATSQSTTPTNPATTTSTSSPAPVPATSYAFMATDLAVSPQTVKAGENVTVSLRLSNGGTAENSESVVLKVNDVNESQQVVNLSPGKSQVVDFKVAKATPGTYNISVEGLTSNFIVQGSAAAGNQPDNVSSLPVLAIIAVCGLLVIVFVIVLVRRQFSS
ncbi:MAG: Ig domain-containing protein [Dehalococcoidia bacterium]